MTTTTTLTDRYVDATLRRLPEPAAPRHRAGAARLDRRRRRRPGRGRRRPGRGGDRGAHRARRPGPAGRRVRRPAAAPHRPGPVPRLHAAADGAAGDGRARSSRRSSRSCSASAATVWPASSASAIGAAHDDRRPHRVLDHARSSRSLERTPARAWTPTRPWTPAALPDPPSRRARYGELIALTVVTVLFSTLDPAVAGHRHRDAMPTATRSGCSRPGCGTPASCTSSSPWSSRASASRSPSTTRAGACRSPSRASLVDIAPPLMMIWLAANDRVLNPAFVEAVGWPPTAHRVDRRGPHHRRGPHDRPHRRRGDRPSASPLSASRPVPTEAREAVKAIVYETVRLRRRPAVRRRRAAHRRRRQGARPGPRGLDQPRRPVAMHGSPGLSASPSGCGARRVTILGRDIAGVVEAGGRRRSASGSATRCSARWTSEVSPSSWRRRRRTWPRSRRR